MKPGHDKVKEVEHLNLVRAGVMTVEPNPRDLVLRVMLAVLGEFDGEKNDSDDDRRDQKPEGL